MALLTLDERAMQIQRLLLLPPSAFQHASTDSASGRNTGGGVLITANDKILSPQKLSSAGTAAAEAAITTLPNLQEIDAGPRGALRALPVLYICLGGEMLYVIKHRLEAQNLMSKAQRVVPDIIKVMTQKRAIDEMFQPQPLYSEDAVKQIFQRMAHVSVMTLNTSSMEKLFDLMIMTTKYYILAARHPEEVLQVVMNHLDEMRRMVEDDEAICEQLDHVYEKFGKVVYVKNCHLCLRISQEKLFTLFLNLQTQTVGLMTPIELTDMRHYLLNYVLRRNTRLSIFLQQKVQLDNGLFVNNTSFDIWPNDANLQMPGKIRTYQPRSNSSGSVIDVNGTSSSTNSAMGAAVPSATNDFHPGSAYGVGTRIEIVYKPNMPRTTHLGLNIFGLNRDLTKVGVNNSTNNSAAADQQHSPVNNNSIPTAHQQTARAAANSAHQQQQQQVQVHAANEAISMHNDSPISSLPRNINNAGGGHSSPSPVAPSSPLLLGTAREVDYLAKMVGVRRRPPLAATSNNTKYNSSQEGTERIEISMFDDEDEQTQYQQQANNAQTNASQQQHNVQAKAGDNERWRNAGLMRLINSLELGGEENSAATARTGGESGAFEYDENADLLELMDAATKSEK